ncbi:MAG: tetratricopeptide repeat-containing sensor histidine kinase [Cyclobacteriaceae bacterium]
MRLIKGFKKYFLIRFLAIITILSGAGTHGYATQADSLVNTLSAANTEQKIEILLLSGRRNLNSNPLLSLDYAEKAREISDSVDNKARLSESVRMMGASKFYTGNYFEAANLYSEAREIAREEGLIAEEAAALNNLGLLLSETGSYDLGLNYLFQALSLTPEEDIATRSTTLNNIGELYEKIKDNARAIEYIKKSLELRKEINDPDRLAFSYNNLGNYFLRNLKQYDSARYYFVLGSGSAIKGNNLRQRAVSLQGFGDISLKEGEYEEAVERFREAIEIQKEINDRAGMSLAYHAIAESFLDNNDLASARVYLDSSMAISDKLRDKQQTLFNLRLLADIFERKGSIDSALTIQKQVVSLSDSLFSDEIARNVSSTQVRFDVEQTRRELEGKELELAFNRKMLLYLGLLSILLLALVFLLMHGFRIQKKQNVKIAEQHDLIITKTKELSRQNNEIEKARKIIQEQNTELLSLNEGLEKQVADRTAALEATNEELKKAVMELDNFIYKTSHDIRGPLARLKGLTNLALMDVTDRKSVRYLTMLDLTAETMDNILRRLLTIKMIKSTDPKNEVVGLKEVVEEIRVQVKDIHPYSFIDFDNQVSSDLRMATDPNLIRLILYNLIENAIKFQEDKKGAFVRVSAFQEAQRIVILVQDNGAGISENFDGKIFDMFVSASNSSGDVGLGLFLAKLSVERLGGEVRLNDSKDCTEFAVEIPNAVPIS